jgi:hypothetical protein
MPEYNGQYKIKFNKGNNWFGPAYRPWGKWISADKYVPVYNHTYERERVPPYRLIPTGGYWVERYVPRFETLFESSFDDVRVIESEAGHVYVPDCLWCFYGNEIGYPLVSGPKLTEWDNWKGYRVVMGIDAVEYLYYFNSEKGLPWIDGEVWIKYNGDQVGIHNGWNWLANLSDAAGNNGATMASGNMQNKLATIDLIKDPATGDIYWPDYAIDNITTVQHRMLRYKYQLKTDLVTPGGIHVPVTQAYVSYP